MDDKLPAKTAKITPLECLYVCGMEKILVTEITDHL